jgi:hypothetical protein
MADKAELEAKVAALEAKVAALEAKANPPAQPKADKLGMDAPFSPSTYRALDRMTIPKEMSAEMVKNVGTQMIQTIVRDGKR